MPVGKYKHSEEHNQKLRDVLEPTMFKKGQTAWNKGIKISQEWKNKIGESNRKKYLNGRVVWNKGLNVQTNTGRTHFQIGDKSPKWKGGISKLTERIRACESYNKWRADVFRRDGWTCQTCGLRGHGRDIEAHHIKPMKEILKKVQIKGLNIDDRYFLALTIADLFDVSNGVTLCKHCHILTYTIQGEKNE